MKIHFLNNSNLKNEIIVFMQPTRLDGYDSAIGPLATVIAT